jgi:hypothetical protein
MINNAKTPITIPTIAPEGSPFDEEGGGSIELLEVVDKFV